MLPTMLDALVYIVRLSVHAHSQHQYMEMIQEKVFCKVVMPRCSSSPSILRTAMSASAKPFSFSPSLPFLPDCCSSDSGALTAVYSSLLLATCPGRTLAEAPVVAAGVRTRLVMHRPDFSLLSPALHGDWFSSRHSQEQGVSGMLPMVSPPKLGNLPWK